MNDKSNILDGCIGLSNQMKSRGNSMDLEDKENENVKNNHNEESNQLLNVDRPAPSARRRTSTSVLSSIGASGNSINNNNQRQHKLKQRFTVIRNLGKGTYGKVQLAINKQTGQEVAIKTIKKTKIENEQDLQRVRREIQIMSSIEHPHIIHIYEVFENKDKIVLVMQYAPGGELYEYVSQSKVLDDTEARRLFRQIATAIYYCHRNKICHRDLKLENILLDEKNNAKLADFGLSNVFDKARQLKTFCGSPLYASPEIVQGCPYEGPEVDCWSLGVLLYTLVYGAMPFDGSNFKRLVKQISEASYFEPKQKSPASALIKRLLCADPKKRANILDVCSDAWVNGQLLTNKQQLPQPQSPTSLVKVAQDMANLTPVRFDILLALNNEASKSQPSAPLESSHVATKPPRPSPSPKATSPRLDTSETLTRPTQNRSQILMEVDDTSSRATSPVASYIVRDLDSQNENSKLDFSSGAVEQHVPDETVCGETKNECQEEKTVEVEQPISQIEVDTLQVETEVNINNQALSEISIDKNLEQMDHSEEDKSKNSFVDLVTLQVKENETPKQENLLVEQNLLIPSQDDMPDKEIVKCESVVKEMEVDLEVQTLEGIVTEVQANPINNEELKVTAEVMDNNRDVTEEQSTIAKIAGEEKTDQPADMQEQEKPKKVKKKIVIKKRKKISKREVPADEQQVSNNEILDSGEINKPNIERQAAALSTNDQQENKTTKKTSKSTKQTGPGKLKIPDTFQSNNNHQENEVPKSPRSQTETRRQSSLIADVSQKLLQQLQNLANERSEQAAPILPGVKVSDKKDEFERRASLAIAHAPILIAAAKQELNQSTGENDVEPQRIEDEVVLKYALDLDKIMQVTSLPLDTKLRPNEVICLSKGDQRDMEHQVQHLDLTSSSSNDPKVNRMKSVEERTESVETIKADEDIITPTTPTCTEPIRSSLEINMGSPGSGKKVNYCSAGSSMAPPPPPAQPLGLTPITRSYKKVTFTKDGACITETGKIYSTKDDDGTMRRVERKSKITHYPESEGNNISSGSREEQEEKEEILVYGGNKNENTRVWQESMISKRSSNSSLNHGNPASVRRNLERLIMPSTNLIGLEMDGNNNDLSTPDDFDSSFRRRSLFSRQSQHLNRAESNSSCSSSSTDVFDDIFDDWTGAISMFKRKHKSPSGSSSSSNRAHGSLLERAFAAEPALAPFNHSLFSRTRKLSNRLGQMRFAQLPSGRQFPNIQEKAARCESAEPRGRGFENDDFFSTKQQPDQFHERPASALDDSERHKAFVNAGRSASLLHQMNPFNRVQPINDLFQELELEHQNLRNKLANQQKQLWKGSIPSLFQSDFPQQNNQVKWLHSNQHTTNLQDQHSNQSRIINQQTKLSQQNRLEEFELPVRSNHHLRSSSQSDSSQNVSSVQHQKSIIPDKIRTNLMGSVLGESRSSSSFLHNAKPLSASPLRKRDLFQENTLPPQSTRRSLSKSSIFQIAKTSVSSGEIGLNKQNEKEQQVTTQASFIELERTSSSTKTNQHQQQIESMISCSSSSKLVRTNSSNSSAFWEGKTTPISNSATSCTNQTGIEVSREISINDSSKNQRSHLREEESMKRKDNDSRIQYWLQDSTSATPGSLSTSQSSASATTDANICLMNSQSHQSESFVNLYGCLTEQNRSKTNAQQQRPSHVASSGTILNQHAPIKVVTSASKESISAKQTLVSKGTARDIDSNHNITSSCSILINPIKENNTLSSNTESNQTTRQKHCEHADPAIETDVKDLPLNASNPCSFSRVGETELGCASPRANADLNWMQSSACKIFGDDLDDSFSNAEVESQSTASSSLLDQLRSRGYRSMINQRMVADQQEEHMPTRIKQEKKTFSSSSISVLKTESESYPVTAEMDTGHRITTRIVHHQVFQSESTSGQDPVIDEKIVPIKEDTEEEIKGQLNPDTTKGVSEEIEAQQNPIKEEDIDPDVRDAKANVKLYLDNVKETELFLKSLHQQEEDMERKRQQMFMFDNFMLKTKLNDITRKISEPFGRKRAGSTFENQSDINFLSTQAQSAPIEAYKAADQSSSYDTNHHCYTKSIYQDMQFGPKQTLSPFSAGMNLTSMNPCDLQQESTFSSSLHKLDSIGSRLSRRRNHRTSFENLTLPTNNFMSAYDVVKPVNQQKSSYQISHSNEPTKQIYLNDQDQVEPNEYTSVRTSRDHFRRSRSQLGDQFTSSYKRSRPLSANYDSLVMGHLQNYTAESSTTNNPYFSSSNSLSKRNSNQMRYCSENNNSSQLIMSEYQSSYCSKSNPHSQTPLSTSSHGKEIEEDDDMSAYRVSTYVPKVVPIGNGRRVDPTYQNKTSIKNGDNILSSQQTELTQFENTPRERRTSLQTLSAPIRTNQKEQEEPAGRRRSLTEVNDTKITQESSSRLSQLEQRIEENRRRREQLLSESCSSSSGQSLLNHTTQRKRQENEECNSQLEDQHSLSRCSTQLSTKSVNALKISRPSRLESMEARIKRRSYIIYAANCSSDKNIGLNPKNHEKYESLEKWRQHSDTNRISANQKAEQISSHNPTSPMLNSFAAVSLIRNTDRELVESELEKPTSFKINQDQED